MNTTEMLAALKIDLGIAGDAFDARLSQYLTSAQQSIRDEGIALSLDSIPDCNLAIMYAAWLWRKRDTGEGMPRMLRWQLNNRLFKEKVTADDQ